MKEKKPAEPEWMDVEGTVYARLESGVKWHLELKHDPRHEFCWHVILRRKGDPQVHAVLVRTEEEAQAHALGALLHINDPDPFGGMTKGLPPVECDVCHKGTMEFEAICVECIQAKQKEQG